MVNGINGMDPNAYLQWYAKENNLTTEAAKSELKAQFGDPTKDGAGAPQESTQGDLFASKTDENSLVDSSIDFDSDEDLFSVKSDNNEISDPKNVDRDAIISALMSEADITRTQAKDALSALGLDGNNADQVDPESKLQDFANATGLDTDKAKDFLKKYVGEPNK